jgi:hypothetical protein
VHGERFKRMEAYTIPDAARVAGLEPREIRMRIEDGRLRGSWLGGQRVVEHSELDRAGLLGDGPAEPPSAVDAERLPSLVQRLEEQAGELAVLRRASAERRASDERERRRLEADLADARRELREARVRIAELEAEGLRRSLRRRADRPALTPLFERTPDERPPPSPAS